MTTIYSLQNLPKDVLKYLMINFLGNDDIRKCIMSSHLFHLLNKFEINKIKNEWYEEHYKKMHEVRKNNDKYYIFTYDTLYGIKNGYYEKCFEESVSFGYYTIEHLIRSKGTYKNDKLHGRYNVIYTGGMANKNKKTYFSGWIEFVDGIIMEFELCHYGELVTKNYLGRYKIIALLLLDKIYESQMCELLDIEIDYDEYEGWKI